MAETTGIEWCDATFNPWIGCTKVGPGCDDCYAARSTPARTQHVVWGPGQPRHRTGPANWKQPIAWNNAALSFELEHGRRRRVFCASLADVFDNEAPPEWRAELFALIAATPKLDWLVLTKRIGNVAKMLEAPGMQKDGLPPNVWLGATVVNQEEYDRDIGKLLRTSARVRFLSIEPMLGPIDMRMGGASMPDYSEHRPLPRLDWVITGGESGPKARPMNPAWVRSLRDQCEAAGVPFLFKQWGEWAPLDPFATQMRAATARVFIDTDKNGFQRHGACVDRVGKKEAGRELDGVLHDGYPA